MHDVAAIFAPDYAPGIGAIVEGVQLELLRDLLADANATKAVAVRVYGGANTPIPIWPGITAMMQPETPLLAGMPTS